MEKRRVALLCSQHLLGESLEHVLRNIEDVELIGSWPYDAEVLPQLTDHPIDLLMIAEEEIPSQQAAHLIAQIFEAYPNLPVINVTLEQNVLRIYTSRTLPARSADLIDAIRQLPFNRDHREDA